MSRESLIDGAALAVLIKSKRQTLKLSVRQAAEAAGITSATFSRIELRQAVPDTRTAVALARWVGVQLDELLAARRSGESTPAVRAAPISGLAVHLRAKRNPDPEVMGSLMNLVQRVYEHISRQQAQ